METIINNITDPSWWFTGLFFVLVAYLLPKFGKLFSSIPIHTEGFRRKQQLRITKRIRSIRFDDTKILVEAIKVSTWQVIFVLSIFVFFYGYLTEPSVLSNVSDETGFSKLQNILLFILSIPIYVIEILYLRQHLFFNRLMRSRDKLRITKPYSGRSR